VPIRSSYAQTIGQDRLPGRGQSNVCVGKLAVGYQFDAIVIDTRVAGSDIYIDTAEDAPEDRLQKIICNARRNNISRVWVDSNAVNIQ